MENELIFENPEQVFNTAVKFGHFSENPKKPNYAGDYMYMNSEELGDGVTLHYFKHIDTRRYYNFKTKTTHFDNSKRLSEMAY